MKLEMLIMQVVVGLVVIGISSLWGFIKRKFNLGLDLDQIDLETADGLDPNVSGEKRSPKVVFGQGRLPEEMAGQLSDVFEPMALRSLFQPSRPGGDFDEHGDGGVGRGMDDDSDVVASSATESSERRVAFSGARQQRRRRLSRQHDPATLLRDAWVLEALLHRRGRTALGRVAALTHRDSAR